MTDYITEWDIDEHDRLVAEFTRLQWEHDRLENSYDDLLAERNVLLEQFNRANDQIDSLIRPHTDPFGQCNACGSHSMHDEHERGMGRTPGLPAWVQSLA